MNPRPASALSSRFRLICTVNLGVALCLSCCLGADISPPLAPLDHTQLLLYHGAGADVRPVKSLSEWRRRRAEILRAMQEIMGPLPGRQKRCPLEVKVEEEADCGDYVRRFITYASEPESRVPAYLLIPKSPESGLKSALQVPCDSVNPTAVDFCPPTSVRL